MSLRGAFLPLWGSREPRALLSLVATLAALALASPALAAAPQTSISDVEDEVMCPICGTLLELAESPQAQRERVFVRRLIAEGKTKAEIKDVLVAQYGRGALALPGGSGFDLTAYLVPAIAFVAAAVGLALGVRRWRRAGKAARGRGLRRGRRPAGGGRRAARGRPGALRPIGSLARGAWLEFSVRTSGGGARQPHTQIFRDKLNFGSRLHLPVLTGSEAPTGRGRRSSSRLTQAML